MQIHLNGQIYEVRGGVNRQPIIEWPDNLRLDGQQLRKDRRYLSAWEIDNVSSGLGKKQETSGGKHLWDVENVDTRIAGQKVLSPAFVTCTVTASRADIKFILDYGNELNFFPASGASSQTPPVRYLFTAPVTIAANGNLCDADAVNNFSPLSALHSDGNTIWAWSDTKGADRLIFYNMTAIDGAATVTGKLAHIDNVPTFKYVQMIDLGGTTHHVVYVESTKAWHFGLGQRTSGTLAGLTNTFGDQAGSYMSPLISNGVDVYAALPSRIVDFDSSPQTVIDNSQTTDANVTQVLYQNYLYFKNKYSTVKYDGVDITNVGYDREEGLPPDKMGEITAWTSNWQWIFAAVKGATYSHILSYDGTAWQYYARWPSTGVWIQKMLLSSTPDSIQRLWCIPQNDPIVGYFLNPLINPLQAGTYSYVPSGYYTPPIYGGGMPEIPGGWFRTIVTSDNINGTNDARIRYGLNGQVPSNILGLAGSIHSELILGSPAGLEGFRIQPQIELFRNSADGGTTPVVREVIVQYLKDPTKRYISDFEIDIDKTARDWNNPVEAVIGSLNYISNLKTLMPFWYGQVATSYVKVLDQPANENLEDSLSNVYQAERTGFVRVRVAEIL